MRQDIYVINDAGSWSVVAADAVDAIVADNREHDEHFVEAHQAALFQIEGDDYSVIRVVVAEPLTPAEAAEWVGRTRWRLQVEGDKILVSGGFDPDCLADWQETWQDTGDTEYVKAIEVPAGEYQVTLYSYLHSMNGAVWLSEFNKTLPLPKLLPWFQTDHPDRPLPTWVVSLLADEDLPADCGYSSIAAAIQSGSLAIEREPLHWIGYLIHLLPFHPDMEVDTPEAGWFDSRLGLRIPDRCPLGIETACTEDNHIARRVERFLQEEL